MFYDLILLNPQHKGCLGKAWIAGTRGVRSITSKEMKAIDLLKLCQYLREFITNESTSPKKRFSLRLSAILLNGTIKIFRQKVIIFQAEVIAAVQIIRMPAGNRKLLLKDPDSSPATPQEKVRSKRKKKTAQVTPSSESALEFVVEGPLELPTRRVQEFQDILQARPEDITLREEVFIPPIEIFQDEPIGLFTEADLAQTKRRRIVSSASSSPELEAGKTIVVVPQVHAPKGTFLDIPATDTAVPAPDTAVPAPDTAVPLVPPAIPMDVSEIPPPEAPVVERVEPKAVEEPIVAVAPETEIAAPPEERPKRKKRSVTPMPVEPQGSVALQRRIPGGRGKVFCREMRRAYVRINRCLENENRFVDQRFLLPSTYKNIQNANLYDLFWPEREEHVENIEMREGSSLASTTGDATYRGSHLGRRSTVEPVPIITPTTMKELQVVTPQSELGTPKRATYAPHVLQIEETPIEEIPRDEEALHAIAPGHEESRLLPPAAIQPDVTTAGLEVTEVIETAPAAHAKYPKQKKPISRVAMDHERLDKIIQKIINWNFDKSVLTLKDICEEPINKLHMARAFYDVMDLCAKKYIRLTPHENSLELKCIEKGPKLMAKN